LSTPFKKDIKNNILGGGHLSVICCG